MLRFLMVSTVLSKKQFSYVIVHKEEDLLVYLTEVAIKHSSTLFFPIFNNQDIENVSDLVNSEWIEAMKNDINRQKKIHHLGIRNWNEREFKDIICIEHLYDNVFKIMTPKSSIVSNDFKAFEYV